MSKRLVVLVVLLVIPSVAAASQAWVGAWNYAGGEEEVKAMETEVDAVVDEMNLFIRPMARSRLKEKVCRPWKKVEIDRENGTVTVRTDEGALTSPLGEKVKREGDDGELTVHRRLKGNVLVSTVSSEKGGRTNEFRVVGDRLVVKSEIFASRLPRPVRFTYTYDR